MDLVEALAERLKQFEEIKPPEWVFFVKSGSHAQRAISEKGFWFKRCASILRALYERAGVGVRRLRRKYGGRRQHWVRRSHHRPAGGKIIRVAMQQLEKAGLVKKEKKGRSVTNEGKAVVEKALAAYGA